MAAQPQNKAAWQNQAEGSIVIEDANLWQPGLGEIRIKVHAAAIQPADAKVFIHNIFPNFKFPAIPSSVVSGIVDDVGEDVTKVQVGERVAATLDNYARGGDPARAGQQRYTIANELEVVPIGTSLEYKDAVAANSQTPPAILFRFLGIDYPGAGNKGGKIMIWGGSTAMGVLCIQYAKLAGYTVVTTASEHNFDLMKSRGADVVFDRNDDDVVEKMKSELPIGFWLDTVSLPDSIKKVYDLAAMQMQTSKKEVHIVTLLPTGGSEYPPVPEGVRTQMCLFRSKAEENKPHMEWLMKKDGFMERGLKEGRITGVPAEVIGGLGAVEEGMKRVLAGVSGRKLVIDPWKE